MDDSPVRDSLTDLHGPVNSRAGPITHPPRQEPAEEVLHPGAEPLLIKACEKMNQPLYVADRKGQALERNIHPYEAWDAAEPGQGYAEKAAEWRAKLPTTQPAHRPSERDADEDNS